MTHLLVVVTYNVVSQVTRRRGLEGNVTQDAWQVGLDRSHGMYFAEVGRKHQNLVPKSE